MDKQNSQADSEACAAVVAAACLLADAGELNALDADRHALEDIAARADGIAEKANVRLADSDDEPEELADRKQAPTGRFRRPSAKPVSGATAHVRRADIEERMQEDHEQVEFKWKANKSNQEPAFEPEVQAKSRSFKLDDEELTEKRDKLLKVLQLDSTEEGSTVRRKLQETSSGWNGAPKEHVEEQEDEEDDDIF